MKAQQTNNAIYSIFRIYVTILGIIFLVEAGVMFILPVLLPPDVTDWVEAGADVSLMSLFSAPLIWWLVIRPLRTYAKLEVQSQKLVQEQAEIAHEQAEIAQERAESANKAKSYFLAMMSHEIRTPMNGLVGMLDLLMGTGLKPRQHRFLQVAKSSANDLLLLINSILDFSKIEAQKVELESIPFNLRQSVEDWTQTFSGKAAEKEIELLCQIDSSLPHTMIGDPGRLRQVVMNLINNALKFTEEGEIVVRVSLEKDMGTQTLVRFDICDTGIGIPSDRVDQLFDPFSQVDVSTTRRYGGTGLGLAITKRLVEMMDGQIEVKSQENHGSTFRFTVKLNKNAEPNPIETTEPPAQLLHGVRVLAVVVNQTNRQILREQLEGWQLDVHTVPDAEAALEALRQAASEGRPFKLALLDMNVPDMDGLKLANLIKQSPMTQDTALIVLITINEVLNDQTLRLSGITASLCKPIRQSDLFQAIMSTVDPSVLPYGQGHGSSEQLDKASLERPCGRLLLAEDNKTNQMVVREILTHAGFVYDVVETGQQAVEAVQRYPYSLVLMDCQMPEMDGYEAVKYIRQLEQENQCSPQSPQRVPIVALTANALKGDRQQCLEAGMDDYLTKPLDPDLLIRTIKEHLTVNPAPSVPTAPTSPAPPADISQKPVLPALLPPDFPIDIDDVLNRCMGNVQLLGRLLDKFQEDSAKNLQALSELVGNNKAPELARMAHGIKGVAANLSAGKLRDLAAQLESMGRDGQLDLAAQCLDKLRTEMQRCVESIPQVLVVINETKL